ncbi:MAG: FtsW/RodA/SpoVE family cell cycle protein [Bacteroidales bacterium]
MKSLSTYFKGDRVIWIILLVLAIFSILSVYSASGMLAYKFQGGNTTYYLVRHVLQMGFSFFVIFLIHNIPYGYFSKLSKFFFYVSIVLLLITLLVGVNLNEASRWLRLPGGMTVQTSDFAKIVLIVFLARCLSKRKHEITDFKSAFKIIMFPVLIISALIFPADFSTAIIIFVSSLIVMFYARVQWKYIFGLIGIALTGVCIFVGVALLIPNNTRVETWKSRIEGFVSGDDESNFQADHARVAIASGGVIPNGPGKSIQRNILPHPYSDFIFAIIVEEYGIILGGLIIPLLYLIFFNRALKIVRKCKGSFSALMVAGLASLLVIRAFVNMLVAVNLLPVTGQTLPFVSMGGTSMVFTGVAFGLILSVSRTIEEDKVKHELNAQTDIT